MGSAFYSFSVSDMSEKNFTPDLESATHFDGAPLARENTAITLSNEQYERLFFQPSKPQRGDLAKRFGKHISREQPEKV